MAAENRRVGLVRQIARVEEEYSLKHFNALGAGGLADYFTEAASTVELAAAVKAAIDLQIPYLVIGAGSGVLFSDGGFPGLVIHNRASSFALAQDRSQIVVDSGLSLSRCVTMAAGSGLGGLTDFVGESGSIGGVLYANSLVGNRSLLSSLRYLTMVMPPARIDREATIVRYRSDWLQRDDGLTRLQYLKSSKPMEEPQPVILTALLQLTSVRHDEVRLRMQERLKALQKKRPKGTAFGPLFTASPEIPIDELLAGAGATKLLAGTVYPDRYFPSFLRSRRPSPSSNDIRTLIEEMKRLVEEKYGVQLSSRYEYQGVW